MAKNNIKGIWYSVGDNISSISNWNIGNYKEKKRKRKTQIFIKYDNGWNDTYSFDATSSGSVK